MYIFTEHPECVMNVKTRSFSNVFIADHTWLHTSLSLYSVEVNES